MLVSHSQDSEPGQLLAHSRWEQPDACAGQGPAGRTETELASGPEPCHSQPPVSSTGPDTVGRGGGGRDRADKREVVR